jgi:hypothetical protein
MGRFAIPTKGNEKESVKAAISNLKMYLADLESDKIIGTDYLLGFAEECIREARDSITRETHMDHVKRIRKGEH